MVYEIIDIKEVNIISRTIYVDILIGTNLIINYFILLAVAKFTKIIPRTIRMVGGSFFGALCAMIIFLPHISFFINMIVKFIISAVIVYLTFGYHSIKTFLKNISIFFLISFCFCGVMIFIWFAFTPQTVYVKNSVVYLNISPIVMIISTIISYFIIRIITKFGERQESKCDICKIKIINNGRYCEFYGKIDTGNTLCEPFSGKPVIVVNESVIKSIAEDAFYKLLNFAETENTLKYHYRLIPFQSVGGDGLLPAFMPEEVYINNNFCKQKIYVAVCKGNTLNGGIKAMINPEIIEFVKEDLNDTEKII